MKDVSVLMHFTIYFLIILYVFDYIYFEYYKAEFKKQCTIFHRIYGVN